jgi:drug/metabolite transporter (DMT)-like permease
MNVVAVRNFGGMCVLVLLALLTNRSAFRIKLRHLPIFFGTGIVGVLMYTFCYFSAQSLCSLATAAIILYLAPALVMLMSAVIWKEPLTKRKLIALVMALLGCALVSGLVGGSLTATGMGFLFAFGSALFYALYTVISRFALAHYNSNCVTMWTFVFAGFGSLVLMDPPALAEGLAIPHVIPLFLVLIVVSTVLPGLLYTKGLSQLEPSKASILANVEPVVASLVGVFAFQESMTIWVLLGIVCVLGSVVLLARGEAAPVQETTDPVSPEEGS